jgi:hypothetical protein
VFCRPTRTGESQRLHHEQAYEWAKEHRKEFLTQTDSRTGKLLDLMAKKEREDQPRSS